MANELKGLGGHSADYFGDTRDHWWNHDHLGLVVKNWPVVNGAGVREVLDVGCGVGHWGRALAPHLPPVARLVGVDRDPLWIEHATQRAARAGLAERFSYRTASAESLPFADASFDLVTCQTLLMHLADPRVAVTEMIRVVRPGGLVVVAESTNVTGPLIDSLVLGDAPEMTASVMHFLLVCQRGIRALGLGNHQIGESLPRLLRLCGLEAIGLRQCDSTWSLVPPYASSFEQAQKDEEHDAAARGLGLWDEATTRRYFLAGGGTEAGFATGWALMLDQRRRVSEALTEGSFSRAGGGLFYVVWGQRPLV